MHSIKTGFTNNEGLYYGNIRDVHFDELKDIMGNLGTYKTETSRKESLFANPSFTEEDGVYIFLSNYDKTKALRIYKDYADYKYTYHNDDKLISRLQERQKNVHLTLFPTGIVSIENKVIGQEVPYFVGFDSISTIIENDKKARIKRDLLLLNLKVLEILKELVNNGIIYSDIHAQNFMIKLESMDIKLIDFESKDISFEGENISLYSSMISNLKRMLKEINQYYGLSFEYYYDDIKDLDGIERYVRKRCK